MATTVQFDELINRIRELKQKRIFLSTKHYFTKEKYYKSFQKNDKEELEHFEKEMAEIDKELSPLLLKFHQQSHQYVVDYEGELTDANGKYWYPYREVLNFKTNCAIDTFNNGWDATVTNFDDLINEIIEFLFYYRFTNFRITNLKKI